MKTSATKNNVTVNNVANFDESILALDQELNLGTGQEFQHSVRKKTDKMLEEVQKLHDPELLALMTATLACFTS